MRQMASRPVASLVGLARLRPAAIAIAVIAGGCGGAQKPSGEVNKQENLQFKLARTYVENGAPQSAIPLLRREIAIRPNWAEARILYGTVLRDMHLYPQAASQFRKALKLAPNSAEAHAGFAILSDLQGLGERALEHHRLAVKLAPSVAAYHNNLGFSLYLSKKDDEAIAEFELALEQDPGLTIAYNNIGFAYGRRGELAKARRSFRVIRSEAATLFNMSLIQDERGDFDEAEELRKRAYALDATLQPKTQEQEEKRQ